MTKTDLFEKYLKKAQYNLHCYSADYLMINPKPGFETEWRETKREIALLQELIEKEKSPVGAAPQEG